MHETAAVMTMVLSGHPPPAHYNDHALTGNMQGFRELHIGGDYLLIYKVEYGKHLVVFTDSGTHSELFD